MTPRTLLISILALALQACRAIDGLYSPACPAFEGDTIRLAAGRFEWDRFTDMVNVDSEGNVVPAFPGYPVTGSYAFADDLLLLEPDSGAAPVEMYPVERDGRFYLLDAGQRDAVRAGREWPRCALVQGGHTAD